MCTGPFGLVWCVAMDEWCVAMDEWCVTMDEFDVLLWMSVVCCYR